MIELLVRESLWMMNKTVEICLPGDKSISHRCLLFASLCDGVSEFANLSPGQDVVSTGSCLSHMGIAIEYGSETVKVRGTALQDAEVELYCGNSGTTARLISGLIAGQGIGAKLTGDESLSSRPMARILDPLSKMGSQCKAHGEEGRMPLEFFASEKALQAMDYTLPVASAQVKSCLILAHLFANEAGSVHDPYGSRDHTERMLAALGAPVRMRGDTIMVKPLEKPLSPFRLKVPGDPSSAAFFVAASLLTGKELILRNMSLNPTRLGFFRVLEKMGAKLTVLSQQEFLGEPVGDLQVKSSELTSFEINEEEVPSLVDEIPILAILALKAKGVSKVRGAKELRFKESDRIDAMVKNLTACGVSIEEFQDGFALEGGQKLEAAKIQSYHDHRIAMSFAVAGLLCSGEIQLDEPQWADISYPGFYKVLQESFGG